MGVEGKNAKRDLSWRRLQGPPSLGTRDGRAILAQPQVLSRPHSTARIRVSEAIVLSALACERGP